MQHSNCVGKPKSLQALCNGSNKTSLMISAETEGPEQDEGFVLLGTVKTETLPSKEFTI